MNTLQPMQEFFMSGKTLDFDFRIEKLKKLKEEIKRREQDITNALKKDFNKPEFETYTTEIMLCYQEIDYMIKHIKKELKTRRVRTSLMNFKSYGEIRKQPYGVTLIMSPWNYPFQLTIVPFIGAIATGNVVVVKPSDYSRNTSILIKELLDSVFEEEYVQTVLGGREENQQLLDLPFDFIFFTGSPTVGKYVMEKAAAHLTPVVLELGGKSPTIVLEDAKLDIAAKRIVWGKFMNGGQTCVAPDYIYVHETIVEDFIKMVKKYIKQFYYLDDMLTEEFPMIINQKHYERLMKLLPKEKIIFGGKGVREKTIEPTILFPVNWGDAVMQEEIFGPILPIITYSTIQEVVQTINQHPRPLAFYLFGEDKNKMEEVLKNTSSGGVGINEVVMHVAEKNLPFGGVGNSGMGRYHGKESIQTFTYQRSVLVKATWFDLKEKYPPYKYTDLIKKVFK